MKVEVAAVALLKNISNLLGESDFSKCAKTLLLVWKKSENCKIYFHKIIFLRLFSENHSLIGSFSYMEFLLHKKFGRAIFFYYREFSLTRSSLIGSFDCIIFSPHFFARLHFLLTIGCIFSSLWFIAQCLTFELCLSLGYCLWLPMTIGEVWWMLIKS